MSAKKLMEHLRGRKKWNGRKSKAKQSKAKGAKNVFVGVFRTDGRTDRKCTYIINVFGIFPQLLFVVELFDGENWISVFPRTARSWCCCCCCCCRCRWIDEFGDQRKPRGLNSLLSCREDRVLYSLSLHMLVMMLEWERERERERRVSLPPPTAANWTELNWRKEASEEERSDVPCSRGAPPNRTQRRKAEAE